jgi:hypothetical protein
MTNAEILLPRSDHPVIDYTPIFIEQILSTIGGHFDRHQVTHHDLVFAIRRIEKKLDMLVAAVQGLAQPRNEPSAEQAKAPDALIVTGPSPAPPE